MLRLRSATRLLSVIIIIAVAEIISRFEPVLASVEPEPAPPLLEAPEPLPEPLPEPSPVSVGGVTMLLQTDPSLYSISTTGLFIVVTPSIYVFCPNSIVATLIVDSVRSFDHVPPTTPSLGLDPPISVNTCVPRS